VVYVVVSSPLTPEETGAMGREIESRQGIRWYLFFKKKTELKKVCTGWRPNPGSFCSSFIFVSPFLKPFL
jgi:hypothetical protein